MPESLLGRTLYMFIGTAACTTLMLCGLITITNYLDHSAKEESESDGGDENEMVSQDTI